jgi:hypothetical protein
VATVCTHKINVAVVIKVSSSDALTTVRRVCKSVLAKFQLESLRKELYDTTQSGDFI